MQLSDPRLNRLAEPLPDRRLEPDGRTARWLDRFGLEIVNLTNPQPLTWTETEIL